MTERLIIADVDLQGTVSGDALWKLTNLRLLQITNTQLDLTLSTKIGLMTQLQTFDWSDNGGLVSTIPSELGLCTQLVAISLENSPGVHGAIPFELGHLSNLRKST